MATPIWISSSSTAWSTGANWSTSSAPASSDTAVLTNNAISILSGLSQSGVTLTEFHQDQSYTGLIGAATTYLNIGATTFNLGLPVVGSASSTGSRRVNIQAANSGAIINVFGSGATANDAGRTPVALLTTAAVLNVNAGTVGVAIATGETSSVATFVQTGGTVVFGSGITLTTGTMIGGTITNYQANAATTLTALGGTLNHLGTAGYTTLTANTGVIVNYDGTGTITTLNLTGTLDMSGGFGSVTVTNTNLYRGARIIDPAGRLIFTNAFKTVQCRQTDVSVNLGYNRNYQVS